MPKALTNIKHGDVMIEAGQDVDDFDLDDDTLKELRAVGAVETRDGQYDRLYPPDDEEEEEEPPPPIEETVETASLYVSAEIAEDVAKEQQEDQDEDKDESDDESYEPDET